MANINEILQRAASLRDETALNSISPERAGGIMYDTLIALNELWLQQGSALVISKIYASVSAMEADTAPVSDLTGQPLRPGQIVVIASSDSDNGTVYRYNGTTSPSWASVGKIGNLDPVDSLDSDSTTLPLAAHQGKVLDGKISQLGQKVDENTYGVDRQPVAFTEVSGKYINNAGNVANSSGVAYTEPFYAEAGTLLKVRASGYDTNVAILSIVVTEDSKYDPVVVSIDSTVRNYHYVVAKSGYFAASFTTNNNREIVSISNVPAGLLEEIKFTNVTSISPSVGIVMGKYISSVGIEQTSAGFNRTVPFVLGRSKTVLLKAAGYSTNVAMIAKWNGSTYSPLVNSVDSNVHYFKFTNTSSNDIEVVLSYDKTKPYNYEITDNVIASSLYPLLSAKTAVVGGAYSPQYNVISSEFINIYSGRSNNDSYNRTGAIRLEPGATLSVTIEGITSSVAVISELRANNAFAMLVPGIDSSEQTYTYVAKRSIDVTVSYSATYGIKSMLISYPSDPDILAELSLKSTFTELTPLSATIEENKYVTGSGSYITDTYENYNCTEEFELKTGEGIVFACRGYENSVAALAEKTSTANVYTVKVMGDTPFKDFSFVNDGPDNYYRISYAKRSGFTAYKVKMKLSNQTAPVESFNFDKYIDTFAFAGIPVVGIIGDSLSSGWTSDEDNVGHTDYNLAWWQMLKRDSGMDYKYFAQGGLTTRGWLATAVGLPKALAEGNKCCAYVVALGVNDQWSLGTDYLGTPSDIDISDYTNNADTFYGNYGKIIQILTEHTPKAKFFLVNMPRTGQSYAPFNTAIATIAGMFNNCYLVDLLNNYYNEFQTGFVKAHNFGGDHYSAAAYQVIGKIFEKAISEVIAANSADFQYIQFALDE